MIAFLFFKVSRVFFYVCLELFVLPGLYKKSTSLLSTQNVMKKCVITYLTFLCFYTKRHSYLFEFCFPKQADKRFHILIYIMKTYFRVYQQLVLQLLTIEKQATSEGNGAQIRQWLAKSYLPLIRLKSLNVNSLSP